MKLECKGMVDNDGNLNSDGMRGIRLVYTQEYTQSSLTLDITLSQYQAMTLRDDLAQLLEALRIKQDQQEREEHE